MLNHHFIPGTKPYKSNEWGTNTMQNKLGIACDTTRMEATTSHPLDAIYESKERNQEHSVNENVGHE
jgi:alpha-glucuronidase